MKKRMTIAVLVLVLVFGGIFGWKAMERYFIAQYFDTFQPPPVTVSTGEARMDSWQPHTQAIGSLNAVRGVDVSAEVGGIVKDIRFRSGHEAEQGALLVQLDDSAEQAELPGMRARLKQAERNLQRTRRIVEQDVGSQETLDAAHSTFDQAQSALHALEVTISKKAIRAPFDGTLGIRNVNIGEYLQPGSAIVTLQTLDPLLVDFTLPQQQLGHIEEGQELQVRADAFSDERFSGQVTAISPKVDPASRNFAVQGQIENDQGQLRPGMFVNINVATGRESEHVTVPRTAINYSLYGDSVFVVVQPENEDDMPTVEERFVRLGGEREGRVAVQHGVSAGETVVVAGQLKLQDGARIVVDNDVELDQ